MAQVSILGQVSQTPCCSYVLNKSLYDLNKNSDTLFANDFGQKVKIYKRGRERIVIY